MADLFLPPMTPIAAENTEESSTKQNQRINYFATSREFTLQTPLPSQIGLADDGEDPTLTWVRSLPSPLIPFGEFGETSLLFQEDTNIVQSTSLASPLLEFEGSSTKLKNSLRGNDNQALVNIGASTSTADVVEPVQEKEPCVGTPVAEKCTGLTPSSSHSGLIDLTAMTDGNTKHSASLERSFTVQDIPDTKKRALEVVSPVVVPPKRRVVVNSSAPNVLEVSDAFSPNDRLAYLRCLEQYLLISLNPYLNFCFIKPIFRASSVESYHSVASDFVLSPSNPLPNHRMTRDLVRRYLKRRDESKIIILHAKVVQKSYGSEKRFFCPPPCIRLVGDGWKTKKRRKNASTTSTSSPMPSPIGSINSPGPGTRASEVCTFIGIGGNDGDFQQLYFDSTKSYSSAKNLHIPDTEKRKHFQLHVKMFYGDGTEIGVFHSRPIKVISKPSKKKQSVKNPELCIASGTKVSFFNRLRSQTVSTRYLYATAKGFSASSTHWGSFWIYLVKDDEEDRSVFETHDGYVHYGNPVKLVCCLTGMSLPKMVIRKLDKQDAIIDTDEPISQLHRCAMFLHNTKRQYICVSQEKVVAHTASPNSSNGNMDRLNDGSCWTIISTEKAEYCWSDSSLHISNNIAVSPVPVVYSLQINGGGQMAMAELLGENFTPSLTVWFGIVEADTMYRCEECLLCVVPEISKIKPDWRIVEEPIKVPLVLLRDDGVLYPTHIEFYYMPEPGPKTDPHPKIREILKSRKFINNM